MQRKVQRKIMNRQLKISPIVSILIAGMLATCNCTTDCSFSGGTESGNARIIGTLYEPDGQTPATGISVVIRPRNFLADTTGKVRLLETITADTNITDDSGQFIFEITQNDRVFNIEALSGNNAVLYDSVTIGMTTTAVRLAPRILQPSGAIKGDIEFSPGVDSGNVYVLIYGIDRMVKAGENGHFIIENLAEAEYDLCIIVGANRYGSFETSDIQVFRADTTNLGTLSLQSMQIPAVNDVSLSYDAAMWIVTITWSEVDKANTSGYNIYRRSIGSDSVAIRINSSPVYSTCYLDSTMLNEVVYEYRVVAIDKNGNEGVSGEGTCIRQNGGYLLRKTIETGVYSGIYAYNNGVIYLCDQTNKKIIMIDTSGKNMGCFGDTGLQALFNPHLISSVNDTVYVVDGTGTSPAYRNQYIRYYDRYRNQVKKIICNGIDIISLYVVSGNEMYLRGLNRQNQDVLCRLDSSGTVLKSLLLYDYPGGIIMGYNSLIGIVKREYADSAATVVEWFNTELEYVDTATIVGNQGLLQTIDWSGNYYASEDRYVKIYDPQGTLFVRVGSGEFGMIHVCPNRLLILGTENKLLVFGLPYM
jgi:hypothetical protein